MFLSHDVEGLPANMHVEGLRTYRGLVALLTTTSGSPLPAFAPQVLRS